MTQKVENKSVENDSSNLTSESSEKNKQGLLRPAGAVGAAVVIGGTIGAGYLFADSLVHMAVVKGLQQTIGAETNLDSATVSWQPFGVELKNLKQTDPSTPDQNLFQFENANASVDLLELMLGRIVIDKLEVSALAFGQPRTSTGQVYKATESEGSEQNTENKGTSEQPSDGINIPDAKTVLAETDLITEAKARNLQSVLKQENQALDKVLRDVPDDAALKQYEQDWKALKNAKVSSLEDIEELRDNLKALKNKVEQDKTAIKQAKAQYKTSKSNIDVAYKELKAAPNQDWQNIKQKYPIDNPDAVAISKVLFGDEIGGYLESAQYYWNKIKPYIDAHGEVKAQDKFSASSAFSGTDYEFALKEKWPDWIVNSIKVDVLLGKENRRYTLVGNEITAQSYVRDLPGKYEVSLAEQSSASFRLNGDYYINEQQSIKATGLWQSADPKFDGSELASDGEVNVALVSASLTGNGEYTFDNKLSSSHTLQFADTKFDGSGGTELADLTLNTLKQVDAFSMDIVTNGELEDLDFEVSSDLDSRLNKAFKSALKERWKGFEQDAKNGLQDKLQSELSLSDGEMAKLNSWRAELDDVEGKLKEYGQAEVDKFVANAKQRYEQEVKNKAEAKLKAEKDKAKQKAEEEKKKAEEKLKNKLKDKLKDFKCCEE